MKRLVFLLFLLVYAACQKKEDSQVARLSESTHSAERHQEKLDLEKAILQTPSKIVPVFATIDIEFREPVIPEHFTGVVLDENPFQFDPNLQGQAKWISSNHLQFIPESNLPAGQIFQGILKGKIAFGKQKNVDDFQFSFKVAEQEILSFESDFIPDKESKNRVRLKGMITFAQPVDLNRLKKDFVLKGPSRRLTVQLSSGENPSQILFSTEPITRSDKGQNYTITLSGRYSAVGNKWEKKLFLPGAQLFRVLAHMDLTDPESDESIYGFRFSDPIKPNMDLSGYISITPEIPFQISIKEKYIRIYGTFVPGRLYSITIREGFPSVFGTVLKEAYHAEFFFNNAKPEIKWLSEGVYIPTSNAYKLQFKSINVRQAHIEVTEIFRQNLGFFLQRNVLEDKSNHTGDLYYSDQYQELDRVGETIFEKQLDITNKRNTWVKSELDLSTVFKNKVNSAFIIQLDFGSDDLTGRCVNDRNDIREGDLYYEGNNYYTNPCNYGYYYSHGTVGKLLISSNIALTVKKTEEGLHVFATNVLTARPVNDLPLNLFSHPNKLIESQTTDKDGHAFFTKSGSYIYGDDPSGMALVKLNHLYWQINNFDVSGSIGAKKGMDSFFYTDRGVHRPGDTIHLTAIVRTNNAPPPEKQPLELEVKNPRGQIVHHGKCQAGRNGHVYFPIITQESDPTGDWTASLKVGGQTFTKNLKVETVKPNRLKIELELPKSIYADNLTLKGTVITRYLFGTPAVHLKSLMKADFSSRPYRSNNYKEYIFSSPLKHFTQRTVTVFEGVSDEQGVFHFDTDIGFLTQADGCIQTQINTTVYESGGNFTQDLSQTTVYPFNGYIGVKDIFKGKSVQLEEKVTIPFIVLDPGGNPVSDHVIKIVQYVNRDYWWYEYDNRDRRDFRSMKSTCRIAENTYDSSTEVMQHVFTVEDPGQHYLEITDLSSGHQTGLFFYVSRWGREISEEPPDRNTLAISLNQNVYQIGDEAVIAFDTPDEGMALLTIEQGDKVLHRQWKAVLPNRTTFSFPVTDNMMPNCYVSVSLIQPHNQNTNDLPMRLYGIKNLYVEDRQTRLSLFLSAPEELRPKTLFHVRVTSASDQEATYTIAIVDEGLLDLTDFQTPSPWDYFFQKIRLGIQTLDNFDEILGVLYPDIDKYFSIGGGEGEESDGREKRLAKSKIERFKPVVLFHEPITIKPGEIIETPFTMPNYVGSVRIMVIGASGNSYSSLEKTVPVKQPLMILPTIPRVARPNDEFAVPVSVFVMDSTIQDVRLSISTSENLSLIDAEKKTLRFEKPGEKDVYFIVRAGQSVGADTITVQAKSGSNSADNTVHLPVISPNPFFTEVMDTMVIQGKPVIFIPKKFGLEGTNHVKLAFSRVPDIQLDKRLNYLIRYPYGCIEQTVSSVFPQLFLSSLLDLKSYQKESVTDHINAAMNTLTRFQISEGFSCWPISASYRGEYSEWGTSYAGHFLIEAGKLGYHVPPTLFDHWLKNAQKNAKKVNKTNHRYQAYRLFLLALAEKPDMGAMNLVHENYLMDLDPLSRKLLAAAYFISGQQDIAVQVDRASPTELTPYREMGETYGSALRDKAFMTYLCLQMNDIKTSSYLLKTVSQSFSDAGWYSTQETAMALLAIGTFYRTSPVTGGALKFQIQRDGKPIENITLKGYQETMDIDEMWDKKVTVCTEFKSPLFVTMLTEGVPLESRIRTGNNGIQLTRNFYDDNGQTITVDTLRMGKPFWIFYSVQSIYQDPLDNLALSSILPSGWEIINTRVTGENLPVWVQNKKLNTEAYMDIRDDRVNWFFNCPAHRRLVFGIKLNPTFRGTYILPPVVVEAMYSPEFYARIRGGGSRLRRTAQRRRRRP